MTVEPLVIGLCTTFVTLAGGVLALRFRSRQALLLGFSSGAIIGVALLDLLPEAIRLGTPCHSILTLTAGVAFGIFCYLLFDELFTGNVQHSTERAAHLAPVSLTMHSGIDGLTIGLALQVSSAAGLVVALAVLAHDVIDGANTITLSLAGGASTSVARRWLLADALAPVIGIVIAYLIAVSASTLALLLTFFTGGFLYIGVGELLHRNQEAASSLVKAALAGVGLIFIYAVVRTAAL